MGGYTIGLDVGSSSVKASILEIETGIVAGTFTSPAESELAIVSPQKGWAQQDPNTWWNHSKLAIEGVLAEAKIKGNEIEAIGVSYQMHGMTPVDINGKPLMDAIIWCDGRTTAQRDSINGSDATPFLEQHLNLPGHFTASKLAWFKENCPDLYGKLDKVLLPGHYILRRATGQSTVTPSGLSEGIFWNFHEGGLSKIVMEHFGLDERHIPEIKPTFGEHGRLTREAAEELGLKEGTPFTYFAGDQPNNAFSLNVLNPGEIAATAGTSAVIYGVTDKVVYDPQTRVNQFLHVTNTEDKLRIGILACINGAGISNRYFRDVLGGGSYKDMDKLAASVETTEGLIYIPFGNGPERTQQDKNTGAHLIGLDLNKHTNAHIYRALQEGVVFAMVYGAEVMKEIGMPINGVRAGQANMFKSPLFGQVFANATNAQVQLYKTDGSAGAARGAAVGLGSYTLENAFQGLDPVKEIQPTGDMREPYGQWCRAVEQMSK
jgi:xylulokinase